MRRDEFPIIDKVMADEYKRGKVETVDKITKWIDEMYFSPDFTLTEMRCFLEELKRGDI